MNPGLILLLSLLGIPILEIAVFILVGGQIGVFATLAMIFVTAVIGTALLRHQGFSLLARVRAETDAGRVPGEELGHGAMILVAGVLLLTPGFVTDALGFLLFVPPVRHAIWRFIVTRLDVSTISMSAGGFRARSGPQGQDHVVDLDEDEWSRKNNPDTPWRQDRLR
ncbi:FxsA family protein [Breoghania sp. L-A4]|uniref:FxsA family protein n=1 Tax=Breoghania sp. L-A4 TaxID=2304600 RepID=UPI000E35FF26|nr:FxsA family protein [Breoghania sp. L-A4]AXS38926.1 membrane protein FxsA [Breoghania sp. L-A4]